MILRDFRGISKYLKCFTNFSGCEHFFDHFICTLLLDLSLVWDISSPCSPLIIRFKTLLIIYSSSQLSVYKNLCKKTFP